MLKIIFSSTGFVFAAPILTFIVMIVDLELNDYGFFNRYYVNPMRIDYYNQTHYLR